MVENFMMNLEVKMQTIKMECPDCHKPLIEYTNYRTNQKFLKCTDCDYTELYTRGNKLYKFSIFSYHHIQCKHCKGDIPFDPNYIYGENNYLECPQCHKPNFLPRREYLKFSVATEHNHQSNTTTCIFNVTENINHDLAKMIEVIQQYMQELYKNKEISYIPFIYVHSMCHIGIVLTGCVEVMDFYKFIKKFPKWLNKKEEKYLFQQFFEEFFFYTKENFVEL